MKNIEIKARATALRAVRHRLHKQGLTPAARLHQVDTYFNAPHGRLKLREIDGEEAQLIHYHRPDQAEPHASDYVIAPVADPAVLKEALGRALGIRTVVEKQRDLYLWGHTRIHLDDVTGLGSFLELETVLTDQTEEEAGRECREVQVALGIGEGDLIAGSYADLLAGMNRSALPQS
jgi:predicted adenylyl cyclase CyaB